MALLGDKWAKAMRIIDANAAAGKIHRRQIFNLVIVLW
jgi:hypothetical protein